MLNRPVLAILPEGARLIDDPRGLSKLEISTPLTTASIYIHGAHITEWQPAGTQPVLFTSRQSFFASGKAIRGGVPVCFPWFANRTGLPESPSHGFVRTAEWKLESVTASPEGIVTAQFAFSDSPATRAHWPHPFQAIYRLSIGRELAMEFKVENTGESPFTYEAALHTYFAVSDVAKVEVTGLEHTDYLDKVESFARRQQPSEPLRFTGETDRVFLNTSATTRLIDPGFNRTIVGEKSGSDTTVVWNPWIAKAKAMTDFADDEWQRMLCIETANTGDSAITLTAGKTHTMTARIRLE
jgi:D-hexose-6-phosphate mutarotase